MTQTTPPANIFKAYDIRGIVDETLTEQGIHQIGRAIGSEALGRGQQQIAVCRDGRLSGPRLMESFTQGLLSTGINVIDLGMAPTPVLYYGAQKLAGGSGVQLTGSHNPPQYNGLKIVIGGETLSGDTIQRLRQRIERNELRSGNGSYSQADLIDDYIQRIVGDIKVSRPMKVVVDCGNGVPGMLAPRLMRELRCEVIELFCEVDGNFPNHHPDPSQPENLHDVIAAVKEHQADIGLAFDGDGDRLGVITPAGNVIWPDRQMMLYAKDILARNPGALIIYDIKCTSNLGHEIEKCGGRPLMWRTGHSIIKAKMKETGALLAGEMSGHIFFKERWFGFDDATYTAARLLEILSADERDADAVFNALPDTVNTPELRLEMAEGEHYQFIEHLLARADIVDARVTTIDGLRVDFEDGWGLVRASNTTPTLILRFEADDEKSLERIKSVFRKLMLDVDNRLELPF